MADRYYRYFDSQLGLRDINSFGDDDRRIANPPYCEIYYTISTTPMGVKVSNTRPELFDPRCDETHQIFHHARRKYAYPTKKEALESYAIRKQRQLQHLTRQRNSCLARLEWLAQNT